MEILLHSNLVKSNFLFQDKVVKQNCVRLSFNVHSDVHHRRQKYEVTNFSTTDEAPLVFQPKRQYWKFVPLLKQGVVCAIHFALKVKTEIL